MLLLSVLTDVRSQIFCLQVLLNYLMDLSQTVTHDKSACDEDRWGRNFSRHCFWWRYGPLLEWFLACLVFKEKVENCDHWGICIVVVRDCLIVIYKKFKIITDDPWQHLASCCSSVVRCSGHLQVYLRKCHVLTRVKITTGVVVVDYFTSRWHCFLLNS